MSSVGYLFVGIAALLIRQVVVGRVAETPQDIKALTVALLNGNTAAASAVLAQRGSNVDGATGSPGSLATPAGVASSTSALALVRVMKNLGGAAKGYRLGATGPDYYDCSGLVWRAMKQMGIYTGPRFTTHTFTMIAGKFADKVDTPAVGDIILWPARHMGVIDGPDSFYSARSPQLGIATVSVSADDSFFVVPHELWRLRDTVAAPVSTGSMNASAN